MVRRLLDAAVDLVLPAECAGCRRAGSPWCTRCEIALGALALPGGARAVVPDPPPPDLPLTVSWGLYADPLRRVVTAWKDEGRRDLATVLLPLLVASVGEALDRSRLGGSAVLIVPAPSSGRSRRARGDTPLEALAALLPPLLPGVRPAAALRPVRHTADQARLSRGQRGRNLSGAFGVVPAFVPVVRGRPCLVVDDVMTTGATLRECGRALRTAGASPVVAATIAIGRRQTPPV